MLQLPTYMLLLLGFTTAFIIVYFSVPSIVTVARRKNLFDVPNKRKLHTNCVPTLGGLAIFAGILISSLLWSELSLVNECRYVIVGLIVVFFIGLKDDILIIAPRKKLAGEIVAVLVIAILGNLRLTTLHGLFGIGEIPYIVSILLTLFTFIVIINGVNLIDGIDGLASAVGIIGALAFGTMFYLHGDYTYAIIAVSLVGSLLAFFIFNVFGKDNKIFMGDTGALMVGLVLAVFAIHFNEVDAANSQSSSLNLNSAPAISIAILIIPLFDTLRVFVIRLASGRSPFKADRNHIHHVLLELGISHLSATLIIAFANIVLIIFALYFDKIGTLDLSMLLLIVSMALMYIPYILINYRHFKVRKDAQMSPSIFHVRFIDHLMNSFTHDKTEKRKTVKHRKPQMTKTSE